MRWSHGESLLYHKKDLWSETDGRFEGSRCEQLFCVYLWLSHFKLQFILDYSPNLRSTMNQLLKSVNQLFRTPERLIKDQVEITGLSTIDWNKPTCGENHLYCATELFILWNQEHTSLLTRCYVWEALVLAPVQAWKDNIKWCSETRYLKDLDRIDGEPMELDWKFSQDSLRWEFSTRFRSSRQCAIT